MLGIICAGGSQDLADLLFAEIKESLEKIRSGKTEAKRVLLIVPAQFTLRAEELAFEKLGGPGFFDFHVMSENKLAFQITKETGGMGRTPIDTLGRAMLLRKLAKERREDMDLFADIADDPGFLDMAGDLMVQMKQNNVSPEDLAGVAKEFPEGSLISGKLSAMQKLYLDYAKIMEGRFTDSEDLRAFVTSKVKDSRFVCDAEIYFFDFYSFTKREIDFIGELALHSKGVNIVMLKGDAHRSELFAAPERTIRALRQKAEEAGFDFSLKHPASHVKKMPPELRHMEKELFELPPAAFQGTPDKNVLRLVRCETPLSQAELIAAEILGLVREKGLSCRDIAVLTGDMEGQGFAVKRMLELYGIPVFMDEKRSIRHHPFIVLTASLLDMAADGLSAEAVLRFLKSGLTGICSEEDTEDFENYVMQYHIKGERFLKPFKYGKIRIGEERFGRCEALRSKFAALIGSFAQSFAKEGLTVKERSVILYDFLSDLMDIPDRLDEASAGLAAAGLTEASEETSQIWDVASGLLDQLCELLSDDVMSASEYRDILSDSFSDIRVGLLPQAEGRVLVGDISRSRVSGIKALFVAGLNDGLIPMDADAEGIFTEKELSDLENKGCVLVKTGGLLAQEELLTVYRSFLEASEYLWLGYPLSASDGSELKPSSLASWFKDAFPALREESESGADLSSYARAPAPAAGHICSAFRKYMAEETDDVPEIWKIGWNVLEKKADPKALAIKEGLLYNNSPGKLDPSEASLLYGGRDGLSVVSPSRIEAFASCPFMHFVSYGLRPEEVREFEAGGPERGDICHEFLKRLGSELSAPAHAKRLPLNHPSSPWMTLKDEELSAMTDRIFRDIMSDYAEGLLNSGAPEKYRAERLKKLCLRAARRLIDQIRRGSVSEMFFEIPFGDAKPLPPVEISTPLGKLKIVGKIDRMDLICAEGGEYVKIIDYKTGSDKFNPEASEKGLAIQLSVYLESALRGNPGKEAAGMFYCGISEPSAEASVSEIGAEKIAQSVLDKLLSAYRMNGILVDEPEVIKGMDSSLAPSESSVVTGISRTANGTYKGSSLAFLVSREEFDAFGKKVLSGIERICFGILSGSIDISPASFPGSRDITACTYCNYKSVCIYER